MEVVSKPENLSLGQREVSAGERSRREKPEREDGQDELVITSRLAAEVFDDWAVDDLVVPASVRIIAHEDTRG